MARRRFYAPPGQVEGTVVTLSGEESHHLSRVLRLKPGDRVFIFDGQGVERECEISEIGSKSARLRIIRTLEDTVESPSRLTLAQAVARGEKFDLIVQKATELGVSRIVPLSSEHSEVKLSAEQAEKRLERWRRISLEALKQCGRRRLVEVTPPLTVASFIESSPAVSGRILVFSERGGSSVASALEGANGLKQAPGADISALIGPEGGWSDEELGMMEYHGCKFVTLGPRVLRTETAAIAALSLLQHLIGDLGNREYARADV
ncbi:MAG TPA: 16S rRNA (uracil(1498)-N(3))-methyltransferase [Blastocatellia bacterium]|jgi:16S rRNA (uracil1498-N3)-methyltransferase|nr:16S rRNA (uracil(1498)-N(3))-methyltransferase [Blastocatellia bacterium]